MFSCALFIVFRRGRHDADIVVLSQIRQHSDHLDRYAIEADHPTTHGSYLRINVTDLQQVRPTHNSYTRRTILASIYKVLPQKLAIQVGWFICKPPPDAVCVCKHFIRFSRSRTGSLPVSSPRRPKHHLCTHQMRVHEQRPDAARIV
jgi:hypothetical protein